MFIKKKQSSKGVCLPKASEFEEVGNLLKVH